MRTLKIFPMLINRSFLIIDYHANSSSYPAPTLANLPVADVEHWLIFSYVFKIKYINLYSRKDHLPEWKLTPFDGNPLN